MAKPQPAAAITLNWSLLQAQSISFNAIADQPVNSQLNLNASASSGLPVSFSSQTPQICTLAGNVASLIAAGTCTLRAAQPGNDQYAAATKVDVSFTVLPENVVGEPGTGDDGDVPLPLWSTVLLAVVMLGGMMKYGAAKANPGQ